MRKRVLSPFLCRELLYDYVAGELDDARKSAVEEALKAYPEIEEELQALKSGIDYCADLRKTSVSEPLSEGVSLELSWPQKLANVVGWSRWPTPIRLGLEAAIVAIIVAQVFSWVSWKLESRKGGAGYTLAQMEHDKEPIEKPELEISPENSELIAQNASVQKDSEPTPSESEAGGSTSLIAKNQTKKTVESLKQISSSQKIVNETKVSVKEKTPRGTKPQGFVYRAFMFSDKVDEVTEVIASRIKSMGGKKAGEVPLGWKRKDGSYFHFTLPEKRYDDISAFFRGFGAVKIIKDPHPRIMDEGTIRFIFWLEKIKKDETAKAKED